MSDPTHDRRRQLLTVVDARPGRQQHRQPCSDCPWARRALPGWLGPLDANEWLDVAHSDVKEMCHVINNQQCAGIAIFRKNIAKSPRDPSVLRLDRDTETVFANPEEFRQHHDLNRLHLKHKQRK